MRESLVKRPGLPLLHGHIQRLHAGGKSQVVDRVLVSWKHDCFLREREDDVFEDMEHEGGVAFEELPRPALEQCVSREQSPRLLR